MWWDIVHFHPVSEQCVYSFVPLLFAVLWGCVKGRVMSCQSKAWVWSMLSFHRGQTCFPTGSGVVTAADSSRKKKHICIPAAFFSLELPSPLQFDRKCDYPPSCGLCGGKVWVRRRSCLWSSLRSSLSWMSVAHAWHFLSLLHTRLHAGAGAVTHAFRTESLVHAHTHRWGQMWYIYQLITTIQRRC